MTRTDGLRVSEKESQGMAIGGAGPEARAKAGAAGTPGGWENAGSFREQSWAWAAAGRSQVRGKGGAGEMPGGQAPV